MDARGTEAIAYGPTGAARCPAASLIRRCAIDIDLATAARQGWQDERPGLSVDRV
jgi:hypothetical protein